MKNNPQIDAYIHAGKESETLLINHVSLLRAQNNQEVFKLGFGQSPFPIPKEITQSLAHASHRKEYMSVQGDASLRKAIASFHNQIENKNWHEDQLIVGAGSKILIYSVMAAFSQAEVIFPAPSWVSYQPQAELAGHKNSWIKTTFEEHWNLSAESLEKHCHTRINKDIPLILVLNYPNNPTGQCFSSEQLQSLALVLKKYNVIVIADEIYSLLTYTHKNESLSDYYPEGCIVSTGLSKWCGAGGWRLGVIHVAPELGQKLFNAIIAVASETYSCAPSPIQVAATTAYTELEVVKQFLQRQISMLSQVNDYCCAELNKHSIKTHPCVGGFYLFPDFSNHKKSLHSRGIYSSEQLTKKLMDETGVALLPGCAFGMQKESLTARLAFVDFDGHQINKDNLNNFDFSHLKKGINKLCQWVQ